MDEETLSELEQIAKTINRIAIMIIDIQMELKRIHKVLQQAGIERATKGNLGSAGTKEQEGISYPPAKS